MIRSLFLLLVVVCLAGAGLAYLLIPNHGLAVSMGIGVMFLANTYFIFRVFRYSGNERSLQIVSSFMFGSMGKLSIASGLFALLFSGYIGGGRFQQTDQALALMLGFFSVYLVYLALLALWPTRE